MFSVRGEEYTFEVLKWQTMDKIILCLAAVC
jgi:hypothetical protein